MGKTVKYSIIAPKNVEQTATEFKHNLKKKIRFHQGIKLKKQAKKEKPSDVYFVFSPVVSRTGTDIDAALKNIKDNKPAIFVVLHHTFDTEAVVSKSSNFVKRENMLIVDCLFYEDKGLLDCKKNEEAYDEAVEWLLSNKKNLQQSKGHSLKQKLKRANSNSSHKQDTSSPDVQSSTTEHNSDERRENGASKKKQGEKNKSASCVIL